MPNTPTLDAIGLKFGTDKASSDHDYLSFYENFFEPLRNAQMTLLEIGVLGGASLRTWEEYFPNSKIIGADINPAVKMFERDRVSIEILDQSNIEQLTHVAIKHGPFDIIVEDGSHMWEHQITSLRTMFPFLKNGGLYVVEDLQTNYGAIQRDFKGVASGTCVDFLKAWVDLRVGDDQIRINEIEDAFLRTYGRAVQFITFYRRACLIRKWLGPIAHNAFYGPPLVDGSSNGGMAKVNLLAHVAYVGDVHGHSGFVNSGSARNVFQGIQIETSDIVLEYRVRWADGTWSDWVESNTFVGTRGEDKNLFGVTVRLKSIERARYILRTLGRFAGSNINVEAEDGEDCVSPLGGAMYAMQIELSHKTSG
jgi:hypothetical protein